RPISSRRRLTSSAPSTRTTVARAPIRKWASVLIALSSITLSQPHEDAEYLVVAESQAVAVELDNAGRAGLHHFNGRTDSHPQFLEAVYVVRAAENLIDSCSLPGGEEL